jgi:hypothetical protein
VRIANLAVLVLALAALGCYHATIETGRPASNQVVEVPWAHSVLIGRVPPNTVDVASECENGVARVETQHSFLNGLVAALTWSIYTPMHITVTCASSGGMEEDAAASVIEVEDVEGLSAALDEAALRSWEMLGMPVYVRTVTSD